ncbi:MAG: tetratricopeptide repeat protein [bacterium]|nr:tetratricopeptide repeat protein [bacterium]
MPRGPLYTLLVAVPAALLLAAVTGAAAGDDVAVSTKQLQWEFLEAETALAQDELRIAASHYRAAVREAWYLLGLIAAAEGDLAGAREALDRARNAAAVDLGRARVALALVALRLGEVEQPLRELRLTAQEDATDAVAQRRFVEALWATGREAEYRVELERLRSFDPAAAAAVAEAAARSERWAPLAGTSMLAASEPASRDYQRARMAASLLRAYRNLVVIQERTGFTRGIVDLETASAEVTVRHGEGREPFGKVDLAGEWTARGVRSPRLDPVALMATEPESLHQAFFFVDTGDLEGADAELRRHLSGDDGALARALLGRLHAHRGNFEQAEVDLLAAIEASPELASAHQALARIYWLGDERRADAVHHLRRAAEIGPLDRDLAFTLAEIELGEGRTAEGERQLRSLDKRFGSVEALMLRLDVAQLAGREKEALDAAERATRLAPNSEQVLRAHARLALEVGVSSSAARSVEPLVRMRPEAAEYRVLLGRVWSQRRKMGEASEAFLKAVELDPGYLPAFLPLGLALNHESRYEEAKSYLERYLDAHVDDLDALAALAESEERLGDGEAAERRALGVLERDAAHARAHLVVGMVRAGRGEFAEAREALSRAVDADPRLAKAHYQLSLACARLRERECAAEHLEHYKKALQGPEATYVQMQRAPATQMMTKQDQPENGSPP